MRELSVIGETGDAEVDRFVIRLVGVAVADELFDHGDHARDMLRFGRSRKLVGRLDAQRIEVLEKGVFEWLGELGEGNAFLARAADRLVVHIGQVHDPLDLEAAIFQVALEEILEKVSAEVPDVRVVVDRRTAGIELDRLARGIDRHERLD